jgi:ectoine hydroxylase-related dioxygenase (phytanoyl-CoA dioxygenase family)
MVEQISVPSPEVFRHDGYAIVPGVLDDGSVDRLLVDLARIARGHDPRSGGIRHLLRDSVAVQQLARDPLVRAVAEAAVGSGALAVRGILFDKTPDANWKVVWHQDLTIAVRERADVPGFGPWSEKEGVVHVQPPIELLADMVAVRIHLDDCTLANGPVRVLPGSHLRGRLSGAMIDAERRSTVDVVCTVPRGGVLAFHSLLLHASSPAESPTHRRVVHLEFVARKWSSLPEGLEWYELY